MRYFVHQHSLELAHEPKIKTVAQLVKTVSPLLRAADWNTPECLLPSAWLQRSAAKAALSVIIQALCGRTTHALQFNYQYKQLISATIVAGWDESEGGQVSHNSQTFSNHLTASRSPSLPGSVSQLGERACRCPAAPPECLTCD